MKSWKLDRRWIISTVDELVTRINSQLEQGARAVEDIPEDELAYQSAPGKWSKKEILGHLIDSAINNLQRFTEIQFKDQPFKVVRYNQDALVTANVYKEIPKAELLNLWRALNVQIGNVISRLNHKQLSYKVILPDGESANLEFLVLDYVSHLEHHVLQLSDSASRL